MTRTTGSSHRGGGAALEFALVLPVLLLLTLPIIDFTWFFISLQNVQTAAQSGARVGARTLMVDNPVVAATAAAAASLQVSMPCCAERATYEASITGNILTVDVSMAYVPLASFVPMPPHLAVSYRMRVEDL